MDLPKVRSIASRVRQWAEEIQETTQQWNNDLGGMCAVASYELFKALRREKISAIFAHNSEHAFIVVDNHVVDITATQFHKTEVFIEKLDDVKDDCWWGIQSQSKSPRQIKKSLAAWPIDQNPFRQKLPKYVELLKG